MPSQLVHPKKEICPSQLFSSPEPKAHSLAYSIPMVRRPPFVLCPSICRPSTFSNILFSKTALPIKAKFYVEPSCVGGMKVCLWHLGYMTNMAGTRIYIYGKNPSKSPSPEPVDQFPCQLVCSIGDSTPS